MNKLTTLFTYCFILLSSPMVLSQNLSVADSLKMVSKEHLIKAQYFRWFQTFEVPQTPQRLAHHMEILSDSVKIVTQNGPINGEEGMKGFLSYVEKWQNSHHVGEMDIRKGENDTYILEADIKYQNILPDSTKNNYKLHYYTELIPGEDSDMPVFNLIELLPTENLGSDKFIDAYPENRSKSLIYYWFYILDNFEGNEQKVKELLAENFEFYFFDKSATDYDQFVHIVKDSYKELESGFHAPKNIQTVQLEKNNYSISFDLEWYGITKDGKRLVGEVHQDWTIINNPDERFAKIKDIRIKLIEPFHEIN